MLSKGEVHMGQSLGSINLTAALFTFEHSTSEAFYWFSVQETFHVLMIQLILTTGFWNCPHNTELFIKVIHEI